MEILILNASPRAESSNTLQITGQFVEGIKSEQKDVKVTQYNLAEKNIEGCTGCFACWNTADHTCPIKDDMSEMIKSLIKADLVLWSIPLYHHTMTSIAKRFIERTLPLISPFIINDGEKFTHPHFTPVKAKHLLVSSCGFPEYHNFNNIISDMKRIFEADYIGEICCVMGEMFRHKDSEELVKGYKEAVFKAGSELAENASISSETAEKLKKPLVPVQLFVDSANKGWKNQNESLLASFNTSPSSKPGPTSVSTNKKTAEQPARSAEKKKLLGIPLDRWLTIGFIPWISSWILSNAQPALALIIPAVISCILLCIKKAGKQTTFFELAGFLYFGMLSAFQLFTPLSPQDAFSPAGISMMHYFALAAIWFSSIFLNTSLTADYSRHTQDDYDNPVFHLTNEILCIFWSFLFVIQGFLFSILAAHNLNAFSMVLLALIIPVGKFTGFFANWYPDYLMKGGKLRLPWY